MGVVGQRSIVFFWPAMGHVWSYFLHHGQNLRPLHWQQGVLATGPATR